MIACFLNEAIFHSFQHENRGFSSENMNSKNVCTTGDAGKEHNIYSSQRYSVNYYVTMTYSDIL